METKPLKDRINYLLDLANRAQATQQTESGTVPRHRVNAEFFAELRSGGLAFILKNFGDQHPFYKEFEMLVSTPSPKDVERARGILKAVKVEIENG